MLEVTREALECINKIYTLFYFVPLLIFFYVRLTFFVRQYLSGFSTKRCCQEKTEKTNVNFVFKSLSKMFAFGTNKITRKLVEKLKHSLELQWKTFRLQYIAVAVTPPGMRLLIERRSAMLQLNVGTELNGLRVMLKQTTYDRDTRLRPLVIFSNTQAPTITIVISTYHYSIKI